MAKTTYCYRIGIGVTIALLWGSSMLLSTAAAGTSQGISHVRSYHSVDQTVERARKILKQKGFRIFAVVDHSANAKTVDLKLPATKLIIFGQPKTGTVLMQGNRLMAIDLPMKLLVWEDTEGEVWINYNTPQYLEKRHGLKQQKAQAAIFKKMQAVMNTIASQAGN